MTLVVDNSHAESLARRLPPAVQKAVCPRETIGLRVPGHNMVLDVLRLLAGPLVLSSANRSGQPDALTAQDVLEALGDDVDLVLDDGPCRFGVSSTVVKVTGNKYEMLRAGAVPEMTLKRLSSLIVLFVCTGNTCRSPMAEALARKMLARRLGCPADELEDRGVVVGSAGVAAVMGGHATPEAVRVMRHGPGHQRPRDPAPGRNVGPPGRRDFRHEPLAPRRDPGPVARRGRPHAAACRARASTCATPSADPWNAISAVRPRSRPSWLSRSKNCSCE